MTLKDRCYYNHSHFTAGKTEAWSNEITLARSMGTGIQSRALGFGIHFHTLALGSPSHVGSSRQGHFLTDLLVPAKYISNTPQQSFTYKIAMSHSYKAVGSAQKVNMGQKGLGLLWLPYEIVTPPLGHSLLPLPIKGRILFVNEEWW